MKIGIIGAGSIAKTMAKTVAAIPENAQIFAIASRSMDDRCGIAAILYALELLKIEGFRERVLKLLISTVEVDDIKKYYAVFEKESKSTALGKNIMKISF